MRRGYRILNAKASLSYRYMVSKSNCLQGDTVQDPFRRSLGHAIQWYDCLRLDVDKQIEEVLALCEQECQDTLKLDEDSDPMLNPGTETSYMISFPAMPSTPHTQRLEKVQVLSTPRHPRTVPACPPGPPDTPGSKAGVHLTHGSCHQFLRRLCPACFGGTLFGRPFDQE